MKKILGMLCMLMLILSTAAFVNGDQTTIQMTMDGKLISFNTVQLKLNDQTIQSDVPPILHNDRTLVPLRAIMENVDAEINWDAANYQVTVETEDQVILLKIDSEIAMVNGEAVRLPDNVAPKLVNNRTMVPIRFVAETIGMEVGWDEATRTVLLTSAEEEEEEETAPPEEMDEITINDVNVDMDGGKSEIRIQTSGPIEYEEMTLTNPTRLVFDLENTVLDLESSKYVLANGSHSQLLDHDSIKEVRVSQFQKDPYVARVVIELKKNIGYEVSFDKKTNELVIHFKNYVHEVTAETVNLKEVVVIEGDFIEDYNVIQLENPRRLVVDIKNAYLVNQDGYQLNVNGKVAKNVRVAQFTPDEHYDPDDKIVRIVIDLQEQAQYQDVEFEVADHQLLVHLEGAPYDQLAYEETSWTTAELVLNGKGASEYKINEDQDENAVEILIPKADTDMEFADIQIGDHMIKHIQVDSGDETNHVIKVSFEEDVEFTVESGSSSEQLIIKLKNNNPYRNILVVIDPGHGGHDPGAGSSTLSLKEKNIVLDVSQRLNKLLEEAGFRTYMTRSDDTYIELLDRAGVANELGADLFISVHANAIDNNPSVNGIETLYYPSENYENDTRDNKTAAQIFQNELIRLLGAYSRGIVPRPNLVVLRETKMPAILSEMGFLTNQSEESKLSTEAYRQQVAEALFSSVIKYFDAVNSN